MSSGDPPASPRAASWRPRKLGQEQEYAIRDPGAHVDGGALQNQEVFERLASNIKAQGGATAPGALSLIRQQFFTVNGGCFAYEFLPFCKQGGLLEGATPECESPRDVVLYQRAQERILCDALAEENSERGADRQVALLKNCRDSEGNVYGAQESYEAVMASGLSLLFLRAGMLVSSALSLAVQAIALALGIILGLLVAGLVLGFFLLTALVALAHILTFRKVFGPLLAALDLLGKKAQLLGDSDAFENVVGAWEYRLFFPIISVLLSPITWALRALAFRDLRRRSEAFFISRIIISGSGTLDDEGEFFLSEKSYTATTMARWGPGHRERALFDCGNLLKAMLVGGFDLALLRTSGLRLLLAKRQRLQIGLGDANRLQFAEYLKLGTSLLVIEMAEAGHLDAAPRFKNPIGALRAFNRDPMLKAAAQIRSNDTRVGERSALETQRFYLRSAQEFLASHPAAPAEFREIARLWEETLDALDAGDRSQLVGSIDWVTKLHLLDTSGKDQAAAVRKKIDLRYHELGSGYAELFEQQSLAPTMFDDAEIRVAMRQPPAVASAERRSRFIQQSLRKPYVRVTWRHGRSGKRFKNSLQWFD